MGTDSQFEQKLFKVLGFALEDPTFADQLMSDPKGAIERKSIFLSDTDLTAAQQFVKEMMVTKEEASESGGNVFTRAVFAPGGKPSDLAATHGDVHGDGHGDVSVGKVARLESLKLKTIRKSIRRK